MADRLRQLYNRYDWCEYFQLKIEFSGIGLTMAQRTPGVEAMMVAARGWLYIKASSPNEPLSLYEPMR